MGGGGWQKEKTGKAEGGEVEPRLGASRELDPGRIIENRLALPLQREGS